jgi:hypothetical protein
MGFSQAGSAPRSSTCNATGEPIGPAEGREERPGSTDNHRRKLPSPLPLVGRDLELSILEGHVAGDGPPFLLLSGEPGIGKTRLLQEAGSLADLHGLRVLAGGADRRGGTYTPIADALACRLECLPAIRRVAALTRFPRLARLLH